MHLEMKELEEKLDRLSKLEYDEKYSRKHIKDMMKEVVTTYKDPKEVNEKK